MAYHYHDIPLTISDRLEYSGGSSGAKAAIYTPLFTEPVGCLEYTYYLDAGRSPEELETKYVYAKPGESLRPSINLH